MLQQAKASKAAEGRGHQREPVCTLDPEGNLLVDEPPLSDEEAVAGLRAMLLGRRYDELCIKLARRGLMVTLAPGIGQEACSVGSVLPLERHRDWFVPQYREAAGQLFHGLDLVQAFLWHMGSPIGFYIPEGVKMLPFQAAVSGQIPHAVGLAWGLKHQGKTDVVVVHFGEGGSSQGDFLEAANLAGLRKAPVIFFCQNNEWAIATPRELQTASETIAQKADAFGFRGVSVDGNDLFAVYDVTRQAVERARAGEGPTLIEGMTYRLGIHTTADASRLDPPEVFEAWEKKDPLLRVQRYLEKRGAWNASVGEAMEQEVKAELDAAWAEAQQRPPSRGHEGIAHVFAQMPPRLRKQQRELRERAGNGDDARD